MDEADEEIKEDEIQAPTFPINLTVENGIDKRTKIIKELYTSENIYVTNLKQMINVTFRNRYYFSKSLTMLSSRDTWNL